MNELMPHQVAELDFLLSRPRTFLFSDVGTGKTPVLLKYAEHVLGSGQTVLWVTEAGLIHQMMAEAREWLPSDCQPVDLKAESGRFCVTSFERLVRHRKGSPVRDFQAVIVDEAGALACGVKPHAPTFRAMQGLLADARQSVLATATPVATSHALDVYALLSAGRAPGLVPRRDFERWVRFQDCPIEGGGVSRQPMGIKPRGLDHLQRVIQRCAVRTSLEDIENQLPEVIRKEVEVDLSPADQAAYVRVRNKPHLRGHHERQRTSRSVSVLSQAAVDVLTSAEGANHSHVVIFTENRDILDPLIQKLQGSSRPVFEISGSQTPAARDRAVRRFNSEKAGILVGTQALETGLNLQRASLLITIVPTWTPARETQREGRLRRHGSKHAQVTHVTIRPRASIESVKARKHRAKDEIASMIVSSIPRPIREMKKLVVYG